MNVLLSQGGNRACGTNGQFLNMAITPSIGKPLDSDLVLCLKL